MKRTAIPIVFLAIASLFLSQSCKQANEQGSIRFGLDELVEEQQLKSVSPDFRPTEALVSIKDENGNLVYDKEPLPLYKFGEEVVTKSLKLEVGRYQLVEFMLVDTMGVIIWATPKEGSPLSDLVRKPLPIGFKVAANETTNLSVEVVKVGNHPPSDFGYVSFDIHFVNRFCLQVMYASRCMDDWNDSILTVNGTFAPVYQSRIIIWAGNRIVLDEALEQGLNKYSLPVSDVHYTIAATNCQADTFYYQRFMRNELMKHRCGSDFRPLLINDGMDSTIYVTPEGLKEPTIRQGVFGIVTMPLVDSTITEEYSFRGVVRDIYFFPYYAIDSVLYGMGPVDCLYPWMPSDPLFISRSNSLGYFQAPLQAGEYLYMVKEGNGFFIDLYVSSHLPGKVEVFENTVTELKIHMIDCSMVY